MSPGAVLHVDVAVVYQKMESQEEDESQEKMKVSSLLQILGNNSSYCPLNIHYRNPDNCWSGILNIYTSHGFH